MASQSSMEEGNNEVKLHGMWASPFSKRVELALKVKGIPYEYIEEDLSKKSELLLQYNPVHKKIPVLVHNGRPIAESLIILQYIDECWTNVPRLLPQDPYERARINFWVNFIHQQLFHNLRSVIKHKGEEQEKAAKEFSDKLSVMEEGIKDLYSSCTNPCFDGNTPVLLSIMLVIVLGPYEVIEEVTGVKIIDPQKNPLIFSWVTALSDLPLVKSLSSPRDKVVALLRYIRQTPM